MVNGNIISANALNAEKYGFDFGAGDSLTSIGDGRGRLPLIQITNNHGGRGGDNLSTELTLRGARLTNSSIVSNRIPFTH